MIQCPRRGGNVLKELKVTDLKKTYGEKDLFDGISFLIHEKDRIGLIGTNGTGKTSLLNILAGIDTGYGDRQTVFYGELIPVAKGRGKKTFDKWFNNLNKGIAR